MRSRVWGLLALAAGAALAGPAHAQPITLQFAVGGAIIPNGGSIPQPANGSTVDVQVFMVDTGAALTATTNFPPNSAQVNNLFRLKLRGFGFTVSSSNPNNTRVDAPNGVIDLTNPPQPVSVPLAFGIQNASQDSPNSTSVNGGSLNAFGANPQAVGAGSRILLATLTYTAFNQGGTILSFADNSPVTSANALGSEASNPPPGDNGGYQFDPVGVANAPGFFSGSITVGVVPEPTSMALCGLAAAGMGALRLRRKKAVKVEETAAV